MQLFTQFQRDAEGEKKKKNAEWRKINNLFHFKFKSLFSLSCHQKGRKLNIYSMLLLPRAHTQLIWLIPKFILVAVAAAEERTDIEHTTTILFCCGIFVVVVVVVFCYVFAEIATTRRRGRRKEKKSSVNYFQLYE